MELGTLVVVPDSGLAYKGSVTAASPATNQFTIPTLAGLGVGKFSGANSPFYAVVLRKNTGTSLAPQGEQQIITAYNTNTGQFTSLPFTVPIAINDEVQILSADLAANPTILAAIGVLPITLDTGLAYKGTVTVVPGADQFTIPSLAGMGAGKFADVTNPFYAFILRKGTGTSGAPQGEQHIITAYNTLTGTFTSPGFSIAIVAGDEVQILSGDIAANPTYMASFTAVLSAIAAIPPIFMEEDGIYFDNILGVAGSTSSNGTPTNPSNSLADCLTMMTARKVRKLYLAGAGAGHSITFNVNVDLELVGNPAYAITIGAGVTANFYSDVVCAVINNTTGNLNIYGKCELNSGHISNTTGAINITSDCELNGNDLINGAGAFNVMGNFVLRSIFSIDNGPITIHGDCAVQGNIAMFTGVRLTCGSLKCNGNFNAGFDGVTVSISGDCSIAGAVGLTLGGGVSGTMTVSGKLDVAGNITIKDKVNFTCSSLQCAGFFNANFDSVRITVNGNCQIAETGALSLGVGTKGHMHVYGRFEAAGVVTLNTDSVFTACDAIFSNALNAGYDGVYIVIDGDCEAYGVILGAGISGTMTVAGDCYIASTLGVDVGATLTITGIARIYDAITSAGTLTYHMPDEIDGISLNAVEGIAGGSGMPDTPCKTFADVKVIMAATGLKKLYLVGARNLNGTQTGPNDPAVMTDTNADPFKPNSLVGLTIYDIDSGNSAVITANTANTITTAGIVGGFTTGDSYNVADALGNSPYAVTFSAPPATLNLEIVGDPGYNLTATGGTIVNLDGDLVCGGLVGDNGGFLVRGNCEASGDFVTIGTGGIYIEHKCKVININSAGSGIVDIRGNCHAYNVYITDNSFSVYGNLQIDGVLENSNTGTCAIFGDCQVAYHVKISAGGALQVYGKLDISGDPTSFEGYLDNTGGVAVFVGYDCHISGTLTTGTGTIRIQGSCEVAGAFVANFDGVTITILGDCSIADTGGLNLGGGVSGSMTVTGKLNAYTIVTAVGSHLSIQNDCSVAFQITYAGADLRIYGNCTVGPMGITNSGNGRLTIAGNCYTAGAINKSSTGDIIIYGNCQCLDIFSNIAGGAFGVTILGKCLAEGIFLSANSLFGCGDLTCTSFNAAADGVNISITGDCKITVTPSLVLGGGTSGTMTVAGKFDVTGTITINAGAHLTSGPLECQSSFNAAFDGVLITINGDCSITGRFDLGGGTSGTMTVFGQLKFTGRSGIAASAVLTVQFLVVYDFTCNINSSLVVLNNCRIGHDFSANQDGVNVIIYGDCQVAYALTLGGGISGSMTVTGKLDVGNAIAINAGATLTAGDVVSNNDITLAANTSFTALSLRCGGSFNAAAVGVIVTIHGDCSIAGVSGLALGAAPTTAGSHTLAPIAGTNTLAAISGATTAVGDAYTMTDSLAAFVPDSLIGLDLYDNSDAGAHAIVTSNTATTITCAAGLVGGAVNSWALGDFYSANIDYTVMTDSAATFTPGALVGLTINNTTDGSHGTVTANDFTTITCAGGLSGGLTNGWTNGDAYSGTQNPTIMTDSAGFFATNSLIGLTINNTTDGSSGVITANDTHTITVAALVGGGLNVWTFGDAYTVVGVIPAGAGGTMLVNGDMTVSYGVTVATLAVLNAIGDTRIYGTITNTGTLTYHMPDDIDGISYNSVEGIAGGSGMPDTPCKTFADVKVIMAATGLKKLYLVGARTFTGTQTGGTGGLVMTDANADPFKPNSLIGLIIKDIDDGCYGTITANDEHTITVIAMIGGINNFWTTGDSYEVITDIVTYNQPYGLTLDCRITLELVSQPMYDIITLTGASVVVNANLICASISIAAATYIAIWGNCQTNSITIVGNGQLSIVGNCQCWHNIGLGGTSIFSTASLYCFGSVNAAVDGVDIAINGNCEIFGTLALGGGSTGMMTVAGHFSCANYYTVAAGATLTYVTGESGGYINCAGTITGETHLIGAGLTVDFTGSTGIGHITKLISDDALTLLTMTGDTIDSIQLGDAAALLIDVTCTAGAVTIYGTGSAVNSSFGAGVTMTDKRLAIHVLP